MKQVAGQLELSWDNPSGLVTTLGNALLDNNHILTSQEVYAKYDSITPEKLYKTANKYFQPSKLSEFQYIPTS